jgi:hypothetical protein
MQVTPPSGGAQSGVHSGSQSAIQSLGRLGRELHSICVSATQPEEIAAALEAHGLNDDLARQQYGLPSVFACAEALFAHLPFRAAAPTALLAPQPMWSLLPRGVLYALPGAALVAATPLLTPYPGTQTALFATVIFGWGWGQGLASIGYRKTGLPLRRFLRQALLVTLPVSAFIGGGCAVVAHQPPAAAAIVGALAGAAFAAFAALLILKQLLLAALVYLPSLVVLMVPDAPPLANLVALGCAVLLPLLALADQSPMVSGLQLPSPRWNVTLMHALSGWTCALFVVTVFGAATWRLLGPGALLPVILSIGAMEVLFLGFYTRLRLLAKRHTQLRRLAWHALKVLARSLTLYLLVLGLMLGAYTLVTSSIPSFLVGAAIHTDPHGALLMAAALLVFGGSLLLGTVLSNIGRPGLTSSAWILGSLVYLLTPALVPVPAPLASSLSVFVLMLLGVTHVLFIPATYR